MSSSRPACRTDAGASAVEYGLVVFLIASVIVIAVFSLGNVTTGLFKQTCGGLDEQAGAVSSDC